MNQLGIDESKEKYVMKVTSGCDDELVNCMSNDSIQESFEIGAAETAHGKSYVEITSGKKGYLSVDDSEYVFDEDGVYVGVYNNNTNRIIDVVRIIFWDEEIQFIHLKV